jgi:hypothetical protein
VVRTANGPPRHRDASGLNPAILGILALALGALAAGIGYLADGSKAALGAACGGVVASGYSWSFLKSHLVTASGRNRIDAALAGGAMTRLIVAGVAGVVMWVVGRHAVEAYLLAFGIAFLALTAPQVMRLVRTAKAANTAEAEGPA